MHRAEGHEGTYILSWRRDFIYLSRFVVSFLFESFIMKTSLDFVISRESDASSHTRKWESQVYFVALFCPAVCCTIQFLLLKQVGTKWDGKNVPSGANKVNSQWLTNKDWLCLISAFCFTSLLSSFTKVQVLKTQPRKIFYWNGASHWTQQNQETRSWGWSHSRRRSVPFVPLRIFSARPHILVLLKQHSPFKYSTRRFKWKGRNSSVL